MAESVMVILRGKNAMARSAPVTAIPAEARSEASMPPAKAARAERASAADPSRLAAVTPP